jgi:antitoxin YefM
MPGSEITYSHARAHLSEVLDRVTPDRQIITVTRRNQSDVALIAADELSSLLEFICLLRSPANAKRLFRSMKWAKSAAAIPQTLKERTVPEMVINRQKFYRSCGLWERSIQAVGTDILVKLEMGFSE